MKSVIIGSGYVGMALAQLWQAEDLTITTTRASRIEDLKRYGRVCVVQGSDETKLQTLLRDAKRVVVCVAPRDGNYEETYLNTARAVCNAIPPDAHLLYTGSTSVYGDQKGEWVTEESSPSPLHESGVILSEAEKVYLKHSHVTILRLAGIYGPERDLEKHAKRLEDSTQNDSFCNWVHREDIIRAIDWSFSHNLKGIYNVCCSDHPKRSELYDPMIKSLGLAPVTWKEGPSPFGNKRVSNAKLCKTGFFFNHELKPSQS